MVHFFFVAKSYDKNTQTPNRLVPRWRDCTLVKNEQNISHKFVNQPKNNSERGWRELTNERSS